MGRCSYIWEEWSTEKGKDVRKSCQKETWGGSDEFCIFHDPSPEKDVDLFKEMLEEQLRSETKIHNFVGYCFPKEWDSYGKIFGIDANFYAAVFQGNANFLRATFQGDADFSRATFRGDADFWAGTMLFQEWLQGLCLPILK